MNPHTKRVKPLKQSTPSRASCIVYEQVAHVSSGSPSFHFFQPCCLSIRIPLLTKGIREPGTIRRQVQDLMNSLCLAILEQP